MVQTTLIILTRNELSGLQTLLRNIPFSAVSEYFLVDYKSHDGTVEFARKHHIPIVHQKHPGRGEAFRIGVEQAKGKWLIFFSPDGNEDPSDIPRLVQMLRNGADMVIASRFLKTSRNEEDDQLFKWRAWANQAFTFFANIFFNRGQYVSDTINGYRAITRKGFMSLSLDAKGFAIEYQMSIRAMKRGLSIVEFPTKEGPRIGGHSTSYAIPTGLKFLYYLAREIILGNRF
jgi:glycosyltransferase involved in cell wall biosynthesis